ncbi:MAG: hypothetical protein AAF355_03630 [Myxococcota bacterium]
MEEVRRNAFAGIETGDPTGCDPAATREAFQALLAALDERLPIRVEHLESPLPVVQPPPQNGISQYQCKKRPLHSQLRHRIKVECYFAFIVFTLIACAALFGWIVYEHTYSSDRLLGSVSP